MRRRPRDKSSASPQERGCGQDYVYGLLCHLPRTAGMCHVCCRLQHWATKPWHPPWDGATGNLRLQGLSWGISTPCSSATMQAWCELCPFPFFHSPDACVVTTRVQKRRRRGPVRRPRRDRLIKGTTLNTNRSCLTHFRLLLGKYF